MQKWESLVEPWIILKVTMHFARNFAKILKGFHEYPTTASAVKTLLPANDFNIMLHIAVKRVSYLF